MSWFRPTGEGDDDLAEEIHHHLELEAAKQLALGHDPATAHARALARFGDPSVIMDATRAERGSLLIEKLMHDLRSALRSLRKQVSFTTLALVTLALGIATITTAFTVLDTVLLRPLRYGDSDHLVLIREKSADGTLSSVSYPNFADWRSQSHSFSGVASEMYPWAQTVNAGGDPQRATVMGVSLGFFHVLGVDPLLGREFTADEDRIGGAPAIMVSYEFWKTQMGSRTVLGSIRFGDRATPVVGVLPAGFQFVDQADIYFPHEQWAGTCRSCHNYRVFARLAPAATIAKAQADMTTLSHALLATYGHDTGAADAAVTSLRDYVVGSYHTMLIVVFGAAALVLLIACTNLVTAQLARGMSRGREMAVRAALGASHGRLVRQLLLESGLLAITGAALGAGLAVILTRVVRLVGTGQVPRLDELHVNIRVLLFVGGVSVITAALVGVYPALRLTAGVPGGLLRGSRGSSATVRGSAWRVLVGFEIAMAVVLLIGSALLIRTLHNILSADTGFQPHGIVTASVTVGNVADLAQVESLRSNLAALPGVQGVAFSNHLPLDWGSTAGPVRRPSDPLDRDWPAMAGFRLISPEYFGVLRQRVLRGRDFTTSDREGNARVAIVTPGIAAKLWPGQDPIGQKIATNYLMTQDSAKKMIDDWLTVVGVVAEASDWAAARGDQNEIYIPLAQHPAHVEGQLVAMIRATDDPHALIPTVRAKLRELIPEAPPRFDTLDDRIARSAADRKFAMVALTLFGGIALLLAGIGIYGTMAYTVTTRTHEIGVRMALGATSGRVRRQVLAEAVTMALGGITVGVVAGLFATRYLEATLYGVTHVDPLAYLSGAAVLLGTALLGAYVPAARSSRVDPMTAIRVE